MVLGSRALKRVLVGRPLRSENVEETLLPKWLALPVFCSDPLSSVAYATEQTLVVLGVAGLSYYHLTPWITSAIVVLLLLVVTSYRQTCHAYPNGGGAYAVSRANLGANASLVAASALLVDYVLTVAVSIVAGVAAVTSAFPSLTSHAVALSLGAVTVITAVNLRGVKESGRTFAIPTYGFVLGVYLMFAFALAKALSGHQVVAESAHYRIIPSGHGGALFAIALALRAFASGCTALTGVEAVSNGVPYFRRPKSRNAAGTLVIMGVLSISMFIGITGLAIASHVHASETAGHLLGAPNGTEPRTVVAQLGLAAFGHGSFMFFYLQAFTALILILAANTAFNGFPILASILARDGYLPRQLHNRGDRLVYSNGIVLLAGFAALLIWIFNANVTNLIHLYIIGVFVSFTLSQAGMVRHWAVELKRPAANRRQIRRAQSINATGAAATALVLVIVLATKFLEGAWIVVVAMPLLFLLMRSISRHYQRVAGELAVDPTYQPAPPTRNHAVVLVSKVHKPTIRAIGFAKSTRPHALEAITVSVDEDEARALQEAWDVQGLDVPLVVVHSPYRDLTERVIAYVRQLRRERPREVVTVFIPEYVVGHWWEHLLHNQSALRIKGRLLFEPGVMVVSVPWQLRSASDQEATLLARRDAVGSALNESE